MNIIIKILSLQPNFYIFCILLSIVLYNIKNIFYTNNTLIIFFIFTPISWTLQEYLAHYFLMHRIKKFKKIHMKHHINPKDDNKIFIPILFTSLFGFTNFFILYTFTNYNIACLNFYGNIICYLIFEYIHYISHKNINIYLLNELKVYHLIHHNKINNDFTNYGFTCGAWDIIFKTINKKYNNISYYYILVIPYPVIPFIFLKLSKLIFNKM